MHSVPDSSKGILLDEVLPLRRASRQMVRELGFMTAAPVAGVTPSQCHALIELGEHGVLTTAELSELLHIDVSTTSRLVKQLTEHGLASAKVDQLDKRRKPLCLTAKGTRRLETVHRFASAQVEGALQQLAAHQRSLVLGGMQLYGRALRRSRLQAEFDMRPIRRTDNAAVAKIVRTVMPEFGADGPGYAIHDPELSDMFSAYNEKGSGFLVIVKDDVVLGCGGYAQLEGAEAGVCELRKMYFLQEARGIGMGQKLLNVLLDAAEKGGYTKCYLETLERMHDARRLYRAMGFEPVGQALGNTGHSSCDAYYVRVL